MAVSAMVAARVRSVILLLFCGVVIIVGQVARELLSPDDLREAEIAREMWADGDWVVPHLAGLPFVEKPPGFQALVALAYASTGGPSIAAARSAAAASALVAVAAVFVFGRKLLGLEGAALAAAILALAPRFCRTAHELLLDNALTATMAVALLCSWMALTSTMPAARRRATVATGAALGVAFLIKGFVGPALFVSGVVAWTLLTRRRDALRLFVHPLLAAAFLAPVLVWVIPFLVRGTPELAWTFFVSNQFGRATWGYLSHVRPVWFYVANLPLQFGPATLMLPAAMRSAYAERRCEEPQIRPFLAAFVIGPLLLLSASNPAMPSLVPASAMPFT